MASKVKEKAQQHQLWQKDEIKCRELIGNFKKTIEIWFLNGADDDEMTFKEIQNACVEIILDGLNDTPELLKNNITAINDSLPSTSKSKFANINKIIDDFEWVRNAVSVRRNSNQTNTDTTGPLSKTGNWSPLPLSPRLLRLSVRKSTSEIVATYLQQWLQKNLTKHNLCGFIQYLASDQELLDEHYKEGALLRHEVYVTTLLIGLSSFETHQFGLLSQIDVALNESCIKETTKLKKSNSEPNVIVFQKKSSVDKHESSNVQIFPNTLTRQRSTTVLLTIRKTKSLPEFTSNMKTVEFKDQTDSPLRPRCSTIGVIKCPKTNPQNIPKMNLHGENAKASLSRSSSYDGDNQPSTSQANSNQSKSPLSSYTLNSTTSNSSNSMSMSVSSSISNTKATRIQLINTDDIKIWTDHTWELKHNRQCPKQPTPTCDIPTPQEATKSKPSKSLSPLNSFFASLFSTPPSYTSWFSDPNLQEENVQTETAIDFIIPEIQHHNHHSVMSVSQQNQPSVSHGSTVFDKFLPIDGTKFRTRKSQNLFEDVNTTLDYLTPSVVSLTQPTNIERSSTSTPCGTTPENCQSLTRFLQMSHLSRNNTDLEKENAHFRVSEAIISAIEHIKWNKLERQNKKQCKEATPLATDCLASTGTKRSSTAATSTNDVIEGEHMPYAELEEVSYDLLSAEVVGLSLISKFDEEHLPKVSELKWLVSDEDTPQKLLPMPDLTSSANPDEHVIHSLTRGTRYWAPPRQQIIFTDHPPPNRKELVKKQNYRCAGCGMRVSLQFMQSFRYCTYFGKYNCTGCHRNQISAMPAKILHAWDFKCYPVSVFAYRLLEQMYAYPLFYVPDLNPALYVQSKALLSARNKRLQLHFVKDFIRMCRFALREQTYFESIPDYITSDIDNWSMSDFIDARNKCLQRSIDELIHKCENHIFNCVLCTARGFLCEYCHVDIVIYPWDSRVERCDRCGSCFHRNCWKSMSELCCRCQRIDKRQDEINDVDVI